MYGQSSRTYFCLCLAAIFVACSNAGRIIRIKEYKIKDGDRITNGQNATVDQLPYIVQIVDKYAFSTGFICGGTIVSDRHIISAAHCFNVYNADDVAIVANASFLEGHEGGIRRDVEALYKHPKYNSTTEDNDIVVLKLSQPLKFGDGVQKAEMCTKNWKGKEKIIVAGWGHTVEDAKQHSNQLQMVKLDTLSTKQCQEKYEDISAKMSCSVVTRGTDACQGDSGGPAIHNGKLCGIVSFGFGCGREGYPGVFASISKHSKFIERSMAR